MEINSNKNPVAEFIAQATVKQEEMVTITKREYDELNDDAAFLSILRNHGVDNWDWYGDACEEYQSMKEDE